MRDRDYTVSSDFLKRVFGNTLHKVELRACPDVRGDGRAISHLSREPADWEGFARTNDNPGTSTYYGMCTRYGGGSAEHVLECPALWVDIDCAKQGIRGDDARNALATLPYPPSIVVNSGGGLHAYWLLEEAVRVPVGDAARETIARALKQLVRILAGDPAVAEIARVMRLPGTFNSKPATLALNDGEPALCEVESDDGRVYDFEALCEWLEEQRPILHGKVAAARPVQESDPFVKYARDAGYEPAIDIDAELDAMEHGGTGTTSIHQTQLRVSMSMIARGYNDDEIVERVLAATETAAPGDKQWNWRSEEKAIRGMIATGRGKALAREERPRPAQPLHVSGNTALAHDVDDVVAKRRIGSPRPKAEKDSNNEISVLGGATLAAWLERYGPIMHSDGGTYLYEEGVWSVWDNRHDQMIRALLQEGCAKLRMKPATSLLNAATRFVMDHPDYLVRGVEFDKSDLIVAEDGVLNLATMAIGEHSPDHHAKFRIGATLGGPRDCPSFLAFLAESFSDHEAGEAKAITQTLQEWFGAALVANKSRSLRKGLLIHGGSRTGKTQVSEILRALLGKGQTTAIKVRDLEKDFGTETLLGKRGWIADDAVGQGETLDAETYKVLVTGEAMSVRRKNKSMIDGFRFACPVCLTMNNLPKIRDGSDAVYNRSIILPMTNVRPENAPEPVGFDSIAEKVIAQELTGVLWWAIEGWQRLKARGMFAPPTCMSEAIRDLQEMNDDVGTWVRQCLVVDATYRIAPADLFASFAGWFFQEKGDTAFKWSQNGFSRKLKERVPGIGADRTGRQRWLTGIRLNDDGLENWTINSERSEHKRTSPASTDTFSVNVHTPPDGPKTPGRTVF